MHLGQATVCRAAWQWAHSVSLIDAGAPHWGQRRVPASIDCHYKQKK
jgi:hypothetical protein